MVQIPGRITAKKFIEFINSEFERLEIKSYKAIKCERTFYTQDQYESGASRLIVTVQNINCPSDAYVGTFMFNCFYRFSEYQYYIKKGYTLYIKFNRLDSIKNIEIDVKK